MVSAHHGSRCWGALGGARDVMLHVDSSTESTWLKIRKSVGKPPSQSQKCAGGYGHPITKNGLPKHRGCQSQAAKARLPTADSNLRSATIRVGEREREKLGIFPAQHARQLIHEDNEYGPWLHHECLLCPACEY